MPRSRTSSKRATPRIPRAPAEDITPEEAARRFQVRTGIDLAAEPALRHAAGMTLAATAFDTIARLEKWAKPIRKTLRREPEPPALPKRFARLCEAAGIAGHDGPPLELTVTGDDGATSFRADLVAIVESAIGQVESLRKNLADLGETLRIVTVIDERLRATQQDPSGRTGSFVEPTPKNRPADEAKLRFARRLQREWTRAGRQALNATEVALAAIYVGIEEASDGMPAVVGRWAVQLRRDQARSAKLRAEKPKPTKPRSTRQRHPDR